MHHRAAIRQLGDAKMRVAVLLEGENRHIESLARNFKHLHGFIHAAHQRVGGFRKRRNGKASEHLLLCAVRFNAGRSASVGSHDFIRNGGQIRRRFIAGLAHLFGKNRRQAASVVDIQRGAGNDIHRSFTFLKAGSAAYTAPFPRRC